MPMGTVLDLVLIVAGIVWSAIFLVLLIGVVIVFVIARHYLSAAHAFLRGDAQALLANLNAQVEAASARTSWFAGRAPRPDVPRTRPAPSLPSFRIPFFRRRQPWWQRLLQR